MKERIRVNLTVPPADAARLDMVRGRVPRATFILNAMVESIAAKAMTVGTDPNQVPLLPETKK